MATKKAAPGKAVAKWDEELARRAAVSAKMEENALGLGNSIGTKGGILSYKDQPIPGNKMNVIILDHIFTNLWYAAKFDPNVQSIPACFAYGKVEDTMAPHEKSTDKQHHKCKGCWANEFESADTGRGKACKNTRRFAMLTEDALEIGIFDAQSCTMQPPVTSVKAWAGYVKNLADTLRKPPAVVVTEISLHPHAKHQFEMRFKLVREIEEEHFEALFAKEKTVQEQLVQPYTPIAESEAPARGAGKAAASRGKPTAGKARR